MVTQEVYMAVATSDKTTSRFVWEYRRQTPLPEVVQFLRLLAQLRADSEMETGNQYAATTARELQEKYAYGVAAECSTASVLKGLPEITNVTVHVLSPVVEQYGIPGESWTPRIGRQYMLFLQLVDDEYKLCPYGSEAALQVAPEYSFRSVGGGNEVSVERLSHSALIEAIREAANSDVRHPNGLQGVD